MAGRRRRGEWSHLQSELLQLIARNLTNICDFVRFRCVCSSWRFAGILTDLSPQLPWLLLPYKQDTPSLSFFNPSDRRVYALSLPKAQWKLVFGSPHGWLIILGQVKKDGDGFTVSLFNPISRAQITFPSLAPALQSPFITKVVLSSNPTSIRDCPVLVAVWVYKKLAFCRLGDESWTVIDVGFSYLEGEFTYHEGAFYLVSRGGQVAVFGVDSSKEISMNLQSQLENYSAFHLVESSGDLLLLAGYKVSQLLVNKFDIYKLDRGGSIKWSRILDSIGDSLFFVSKMQSMSICSKDFLCWRENCGYSATEDFLDNSGFGAARIPRLHLLHTGFGCAFERQPYYWQAPRRLWTDWKDMTGLSWFIPSLC